MDAKYILITGGDGYLGSRLARPYLKHTDMSVRLCVRASNADEFQIKRNRLHLQFGDCENRVGYEWGDLVRDHPFDTLDPRRIRTIIHTAAVTKFNVDPDTARAVNIEGAEKL